MILKIEKFTTKKWHFQIISLIVTNKTINTFPNKHLDANICTHGPLGQWETVPYSNPVNSAPLYFSPVDHIIYQLLLAVLSSNIHDLHTFSLFDLSTINFYGRIHMLCSEQHFLMLCRSLWYDDYYLSNIRLWFIFRLSFLCVSCAAVQCIQSVVPC